MHPVYNIVVKAISTKHRKPQGEGTTPSCTNQVSYNSIKI